MWRLVLFILAIFPIFGSSEIKRKSKTVPLTQKTCPCWWDLEGILIDPATNEPFKCACCKNGGRQCGYPMHEWCTNSKDVKRGCVGKYILIEIKFYFSWTCLGTANWPYTLSEIGYPCHFDRSRRDCAWCTSSI